MLLAVITFLFAVRTAFTHVPEDVAPLAVLTVVFIILAYLTK